DLFEKLTATSINRKNRGRRRQWAAKIVGLFKGCYGTARGRQLCQTIFHGTHLQDLFDIFEEDYSTTFGPNNAWLLYALRHDELSGLHPLHDLLCRPFFNSPIMARLTLLQRLIATKNFDIRGVHA